MQDHTVRPTTRREFVASAATLALAAALPRTATAQITSNGGTKTETQLAADPMRPQFHLLPARNWMNDPNGPIYFNGQYHLFFQYNPLGPTWGDMSWYHSVSPDMVRWSHRPLAFSPTPGTPDAFGCFSGSAIQVGKRVYAVYTATRESTPELATIRDGEDKIQESQCLAWSDDPGLVRWTKDPEPIVLLPPAGMKITGFRDPSAWKQGDWYYMTVGSGEAKVGGCVLLYRSRDLKIWEYLHKLTGGTWNGTPTANPCDDGEMWECPELFALDGRHVLIYSTLGKVFWQSGALDEATMTFKELNTGLLDLDAFYAPKTQLDAHGRRILWGWIPERRSEAAMREAGWSGMMSLPRVMTLDGDGMLRLQILPQTAMLRSHEVKPIHASDGTTFNLARANGEVICAGKKGSDFEVVLQAGSAELMRIRYSSSTHRVIADGKEILLQPDDVPAVHLFVDGSVIELIVSERIGYTKRFYQAKDVAPDIHLTTSGTGVMSRAWQISAISNNRLTTPSYIS